MVSQEGSPKLFPPFPKKMTPRSSHLDNLLKDPLTLLTRGMRRAPELGVVSDMKPLASAAPSRSMTTGRRIVVPDAGDVGIHQLRGVLAACVRGEVEMTGVLVVPDVLGGACL